MKDQQDNTVSLLRQIVERRGLDYLREGNGKFFVNAFSEMGGEKQDVRLLRYLTECGTHEDLLDAASLTPAMQRAYYSQAVQKLCDKTLIPENMAHRACGSFWQAVYNTEPPVAAPVPSMPKSKQSVHQTKPPVSGKDEVVKAPPVDTGKKEKPVPVPPKPKPQIFSGKKLAFLGFAVLLALALISVVTGGDSTKRTRSDLAPYNLEDSIEDMLLAGTEEIYTYPDGTWMEFYYDDAGQEIYRVYVNTENDIENLFEARYDDSGRLVYHQIFDGDGNLLRADSYDFHSSEDTAQRRITLGDGRSFQGQSTFDENGYETFILNHQDGTKTVYVYKDGGVLTNLTEYDAAGEITDEPIAYDWWEGQPKVCNSRQTVIGWAGSNGYVRPYVQGICGGKMKEYSVEDDHAFIETYDSMGNLLEQLYYRDGQLNELGSREVYSYDAQGNYTGYTETFYTSVGDGNYTVTVYDENGIRLSMESHFFEGEEESVSYYRYDTKLDDQGREICVREYDGETGQLKSIEEYEYDSQGNRIKRTRTAYAEDGGYSVFVEDGEGKNLSDITYYPNGNIRRQTEYSKDGVQSKWTTYYENGQVQSLDEFNAAGKKVKDTWYYENGQVERVIEFNDAGDTMSEIGYYENGKTEFKHEYNSAGQEIRYTRYYKNGSKKFVAEYDDQGQVVRSVYYNEDGTIAE